MTLGGKIRKLDIYKKMPIQLSEGTNIGGLISLLTVWLIGFLLYTQLSNFLNAQYRATLAKDQHFTRDQMRIHVDIEFPRFPCEIISLDIQDIMLSHHPNIGSIKKWRLDSQGNYIDGDDFQLLREPNIHKQYQVAREAFKKQYGCRLKGSFTVKEVPGNFHISSHAYANVFMRLSLQETLKDLNVSHIIHDLHFGQDSDITFITQKHPQSVLNQLANNRVIYNTPQQIGGYISHYHIDIVPTLYQQSIFNKVKAFQYTSNHNDFKVQHMPVVYFNYHIGGLAVIVTPDSDSLLGFLVKLCAIVGGTYTIASFLDMLLNRLFRSKYQQYELTK